MLETAKGIAREAGQLLRQGQLESFRIDSKSSDVDLVTEYDHKAEQLIVGRLREWFPDHGIVGEEGSSFAGREGSQGYRWYVDPLDGTNNFAHRIPHFAVSMGLFLGDQPVLGVVYDPMRDEMYWAERGRGAFRNDIPLKVSQAPTVGKAILASGFPYDRHHDPVDNIAQMALFLKKCQGFRRFGAAALDLAMVAAGSLDGFWEFKLSPWDVAAGILLVAEAGGTVTRIDGAPMGHPTRKIHLVASNGLLHQEMLEILKPSLSELHLQTGPVV
jgi:myo-inositol-1(or 4)-monophosphatase